MRFPLKFKRYKGALPATGGIILGTDTVPTTGPSNQDNLISARFANINGWPASKLVVGMKGPATVDAKNVSFYMWEETSASWYKLPTTDTLTPDGFVYFTCPTLVDPPQVGAGYSDKSAGCLEVLVIVAANGTAPDGEYTFVVGLSTLERQTKMKAGKLSLITGKIPGFIFSGAEKIVSTLIDLGLDLHMKLLDTFPDRYQDIKKEFIDSDDSDIPYADELQEGPPPVEVPVNPGYPNTYVETDKAKELRDYKPTWNEEAPTVPDKPLKGSYAERMLRK